MFLNLGIVNLFNVPKTKVLWVVFCLSWKNNWALSYILWLKSDWLQVILYSIKYLYQIRKAITLILNIVLTLVLYRYNLYFEFVIYFNFDLFQKC